MPLHRHIADNQGKLDATGVGLSALCIAHCLFLPAAAAATPMLAPEAGELLGLSHGLSIMALGASHVFSTTIETVLTLTGVIVLAGAHFANWRTRARAGHVHERDCGLCDDHSH